MRINALRVDSWRVSYVFESDNRVFYEALSSYMYKLLDHPQMESAILFEQYPAAKKCLGGVDVEVSVKDGIASFRGEFSTFTIGEPYCTIPEEQLKLFNKFLGVTINNSKTEFCKEDDGNFLFSVDKEHYRTDVRLSTKASLHNILLIIILGNCLLSKLLISGEITHILNNHYIRFN